MAMDTFDIATNWAGDPYGLSDTPGMVATTGNTTGVMTDDGMIGSPRQAGAKQQMQSSTPMGNPFVGLAVAAVGVFLLMWIVHHFGKDSNDFANPKASAYTVAITGLSAALMIPLLKIGTGALAQTKLPLTAELNTYISAA